MQQLNLILPPLPRIPIRRTPILHGIAVGIKLIIPDHGAGVIGGLADRSQAIAQQVAGLAVLFGDDEAG